MKSLATQTAKATDDIARQIDAIQRSSGGAVAAINEIARIIGQIDQVATGIASAVEEEGAATKEIARNVQQAATGTHEVSSNIGGVSAARFGKLQRCRTSPQGRRTSLTAISTS